MCMCAVTVALNQEGLVSSLSLPASSLPVLDVNARLLLIVVVGCLLACLLAPLLACLLAPLLLGVVLVAACCCVEPFCWNAFPATTAISVNGVRSLVTTT